MLLKNQVLKHEPTSTRWRVLELDDETQTVWMYNMDHPTAVPEDFPADKIESSPEFGEIDAPRVTERINLSEAAQRHRDKAFAYIEPLVATMDIFDPGARSTKVLARAAELGCSPQTLYKYLRQWWRNGQCRQALAPRFHKSGNTAGGTSGRGRPTIDGRPIYQVTGTDSTYIQQAVKNLFLKDGLKTLELVYQTVLEKHYSYIDGEGCRVLNMPGERPSSAQFRRQALKNLPTEKILRARKGDADFELQDRPVLGSHRQATFTVGDGFEIDSTVADVLLVHQDDRSQIIGKPSLYLIRDRKSSLITGFYVGLEEASWLAAHQAILSITEDKEALCRRFGLTYDPADWPAHRIMPKEFIADRGPEMLSGQSDRIADGLELIITNLPTKRGDWKPHVEIGFKQVQRAMRGVIPGYVPPEDRGKRQRLDPAKGAALTLEEFRRIVLEAILRFNRSPMPGYPLAPEYVLQAMQPTPINLWNAEVRRRAGLLGQYNEDDVRLALLPRTEATVTREGICLGECFYGAPEATDKGWFIAAGDGRFKVQVSYDLRCIDKIWIHDESHPNLCFEARLLDKCAHFRGMSHREVEALGFLSRELRRDGEQLRRQRTADFHGAIAATVDQAKTETKKATSGRSRSARKADTRAARIDAKRQERQESVRGTPVTATETANVIALPSHGAAPPSTVSKSYQQKYEEILNGR